MGRAHALEEVVDAIGTRELAVVDARLQAEAVLDAAPVEAEPQILFMQKHVGVLGRVLASASKPVSNS